MSLFTLCCSALDFNLHLQWRQPWILAVTSGEEFSVHFLEIVLHGGTYGRTMAWASGQVTDGDFLSLKSELQAFLPWVGHPMSSQMPRSILVQCNTPVLFQDGYHMAEVNILRYVQSGTLKAFDQAIMSIPESVLFVDLKPPWAATVWGVLLSKAMSHTPARAQVQQNGGLCLRPSLPARNHY